MNKMPKKVITDYTFYKIVCLDNSVDLCYVGSTADFNKRRSTHKCDCYNENIKAYNTKIYKTIRENGGWDNFKMIEIGKKEQLTKRQAEQVEEEYRQELKANMNGRRCFTTEEQKEQQKKDCDKKRYEKNKDKILEQKHNYYENNKDKILVYYHNYYEDNKNKINEKVKCECGCDVLKRELIPHQKTKKHIKLMEIKTENEN